MRVVWLIMKYDEHRGVEDAVEDILSTSRRVHMSRPA